MLEIDAQLYVATLLLAQISGSAKVMLDFL